VCFFSFEKAYIHTYLVALCSNSWQRMGIDECQDWSFDELIEPIPRAIVSRIVVVVVLDSLKKNIRLL
jgi:hypothetical protein